MGGVYLVYYVTHIIFIDYIIVTYSVYQKVQYRQITKQSAFFPRGSWYLLYQAMRAKEKVKRARAGRDE